MRRTIQPAFAVPVVLVGLAFQTACGGGGGGGTTPPAPTPAPTVASFNPTHGSPGTSVSLVGTNFVNVTGVKFGNVAAFSFNRVSTTQIDAVVPGGAVSAAITVSTGTGTGSSATFTVDAAQTPTFTSFSPSVGAAGSTVTILGTHFVGATTVAFNGTAATSFTVVNDGQITAVVPAGAVSGTVSVTTPGGTATSATGFTIGSPVQVMMNAGFESGTGVWGANNGFIGKASTTNPAIAPRTGTYLGWLGGYGDGTTDQGWQDINVPSASQSATLNFWLKVVTTETGAAAKDTFTLSLRTTGGTVLATPVTKTNLDATGSWAQYTVDLLPYKGQVLRVFLNSAEDASNATNFLVDDFAANIITSPASALAPLVDNFTPTSGVLGEGTVTVTGRNLFGVTGVTIGGHAATYTSVDGTSLTATVPATATPGNAAISITNAQGTGASAGTFNSTYGTATVASVNPSQGPVNTPVVVIGTYLGYPGTTVTFGGAPVTLTSQSMNQLTFSVPAGAALGSQSVVITTPQNGLSRSFTVNSAASTLDFRVDRLQLTQSTQTLDNSVPIVAGKDGLVRAFVLANTSNTATPTVQITLLNNGIAVAGYPKIVNAPGASVPTTLAEGTLASSWNLVIPGADLTSPTGSGYSLQATVNPGGTITEADASNNAFTAALTGVTVPTFKTTIFPVVLASGTGDINSGNKDAWAARLKKMYPVGAVDVQVGATFTGSVSTLASNGDGWDVLLNDLTTKHQSDGASDRYYFGALSVSYGSGVAGLGWVPGTSGAAFKNRTAIGWDKTGYGDGGNFPEVFAHETGHNMGRPHSPCGGVAGPDPNYPYAGGLIGQWGYDSVANTLQNPATTKDIMAYCSPNWVSDYVYKKILAFRNGAGGFLTVGAGAEDAPLPKALAQRTECLLVRGILHEDGTVTFLPGFRTQALPTATPAVSEYQLQGVDAAGQACFSQPLELMDLGCGPFTKNRHFLVALPVNARLEDLASLQILHNGELRAEKAVRASVSEVEPEALALPNGRIRLTWDAEAHEAVLVRHPETGEVVAILKGGQAEFEAGGQSPAHFDVVLSGAVKATTRRTRVIR